MYNKSETLMIKFHDGLGIPISKKHPGGLAVSAPNFRSQGQVYLGS